MQQSSLRFRSRSRRSPLRLLADPSTQTVGAGRRARFSLRIENLSSRLQDVEIYAEEALDGWLGELKVHRLRLPSWGAAVLFLRVTAPAGAFPGERQTFQVVAVGSQAPDAPATVLLEATVDGSAALPA